MKILFQGSLGAYSHLAALEIYPDAEIIDINSNMMVNIRILL